MSIYAVNGKEPVAAWIPSLDTSGNGTTTLTDLVGSYDGTLTNMDAATDWVADTDAGGVRALDFDGSNDLVTISGINSIFGGLANASISMWSKKTGSYSLLGFGENQSSRFNIVWDGTLVYFQVENGGASYPNITLNSTAWNHIVMSFDGSLVGLARVAVYINGTSRTLTSGGASPAATLANAANLGDFVLGATNADSRHTTGRHDDIRLFSASLDLSDAQYLYNSGTGRGIVAASGAPAVNAQHNNMRNIRMAP